jgi:hypothetical protein
MQRTSTSSCNASGWERRRSLLDDRRCVIGLAVTRGDAERAGGHVVGDRVRTTSAAASLALASSFLAAGLERFDRVFERARGEPIAECRVVAKEGLEAVGWSLVALALWDEALRGASTAGAATARASRAPAASRRRAA